MHAPYPNSPSAVDGRGSQEMQHLFADANFAIHKMLISQRRAGCCRECMGCEAKTEFDYYDNNKNRIASSVAESGCCQRTCCPSCYAFETEVKSQQTGQALLTVKHPFACQPSGCKCCCYQTVDVYSHNDKIGDITEDCWYCVPRFTVTDARYGPVYTMHQPTCCGGCCVNCCAAGCCNCKVPFNLFPYVQKGSTDGNVKPAGVIMKEEKSMFDALLTDADNFRIDFPRHISAQQRALLIGATLLINFSFFEGQPLDKENTGATA